MYKLFIDGFQRKTSSQKFIPEVDFIRFIAIAVVAVYHINGFINVKTSKQIPLGDTYNHLVLNGDLGVELFFVLSGFILSIPFAKHYFQEKKYPDIKKFYLRRLTRLEPPYIIVMSFCFLAVIFLKPGESFFYLKSFGASLIYMHNIFLEHTPFLNVVAWSLEIEVFFYLSFPVLANFFKFSKIIRRISLIICAIIIPLISKELLNFSFPFILDYLGFFLIGMLLCDIYLTERKLIFNKHLVLFLTISLLVLLFSFSWKDHTYFYITLFPLIIGSTFFLILSNAFQIKFFRNTTLVVIGGM